jgi:hypothetical protein
MIQQQLEDGTLLVLTSAPQVEPGRLFASFWDGGQTPAVDAVIASVRQVVAHMEYLAPAV